MVEEKCHVCGKNTEHTHPNWMWLANPTPKFKEGEAPKKVIEYAEQERELNTLLLKKIIVGR